MALRKSVRVLSTSEAANKLPALLRAGLDTLEFGFAIFDSDLKLVASNAAFRTLRSYPAALCEPGELVSM